MTKYLLALFVFFAPNVFAAYAQLKPPAAWVAPTSSVAATAGFRGGAANDAKFVGSTVLTNAALNVGGQAITVPVGLRIAANAGTTAAAFAFGNPYLFAGIAVGTALYEWYHSQNLSTDGQGWFSEAASTCNATSCTEFRAYYGTDTSGWFGTALNSANALIAKFNAEQTSRTYRLRFEGGDYYADMKGLGSPNEVWNNYYYRFNIDTRGAPLNSAAKTPIAEAAFVDRLKAYPVPDALPPLAPNITFPVELPVFNPDPAVAPLPAPSPVQRPLPMWIPTGEPVKNPNPTPATNPDTWTQPGVRVTPSPTSTDPWRVDVVTEPKTKSDPSTNSSTPPTSTAAKPEPLDIQTCGLPGKPKCLIDETGTPTADPAIDGQKAADIALAKLKEFAANPQGSLPALPSLNWAFRLPTGCVPLQITAFAPFLQTIDICQFQPMFHDIMAMVWTIGGLFGAIGLFWRNTLSQN